MDDAIVVFGADKSIEILAHCLGEYKDIGKNVTGHRLLRCKVGGFEFYFTPTGMGSERASLVTNACMQLQVSFNICERNKTIY